MLLKTRSRLYEFGVDTGHEKIRMIEIGIYIFSLNNSSVLISFSSAIPLELNAIAVASRSERKIGTAGEVFLCCICISDKIANRSIYSSFVQISCIYGKEFYRRKVGRWGQPHVVRGKGWQRKQTYFPKFYFFNLCFCP